jgi:hypothetical protein
MRHAFHVTVLVALAATLGCESTHEYFDVATDSPDVVEETGDQGDTETAGDAADEATPGTASCSAVLACMQACADTPCVDACRATVCPAHQTMLDDLMTCIEAGCATQCADFTATACLNCIMSACATQGTACYGATACS